MDPPQIRLWVRLIFLSDLWVRLTFGQTYPLVEASGGQEWYYIRSAQHLVSIWVTLTFGQTYPLVEASSSYEWY